MTPLSYRRIGIFGLGLIGGSIAAVIRKHYPDIPIFGVARRRESIALALEKGLITDGSTEISAFPEDTELIFVCTPIHLTAKHIESISQTINHSLILTDVASIKSGIKLSENGLKEGDLFIPGHPMAGSEHTGLDYASEQILSHATYLIEESENPNVKRFEKFLSSLDFHVLGISNSLHDKMVSAASHIPYLMAQLCLKAGENISETELPLFKQIISSGFYDTTRVSSSDPEWGRDICTYNKENLLKDLEIIAKETQTLIQLISANKAEELDRYFSNGKRFRKSLYD